MNETQEPILDANAVAQAGTRLETFAATLSDGERAALRVLLARAGGATAIATLAAQPVAAVLSEPEAALYARLAAEPAPAHPGRRPSLSLMMKVTRLCNLRCSYCHYWRTGPNQTMPFPVLARAIRDALHDPAVRVVEFVWHGGEPTLLPLDFYRKALWLQERFRRPDQRVYNSVQTNATRLNDAWLTFLRDYSFDVGVSLDGPPEVHDARRVDIAGRPTEALVRAGLEQLKAFGVRNTGVLMVVDEDVIALGAGRLLAYLLAIGVQHVGLHNARPDNVTQGAPRPGEYLAMDRYVAFLRDLFHAWYPAYVDRITFRELADLAGALRGGTAQTCFFAGNCHGGFLTVEPTGEITACDKYIEDDAYTYGNIVRSDLIQILDGESLWQVERENAAALARQEASCIWFAVCHGACPHDRYTANRRTPGLLQNCCGYAPLIEDIAATIEREAGSGKREA